MNQPNSQSLNSNHFGKQIPQKSSAPSPTNLPKPKPVATRGNSQLMVVEPPPPPPQIIDIFQEDPKIFSPTACSRCGREGHSEKKCYARTDIYGGILPILIDDESEEETKPSPCFRCGRNGHISTTCYAKTHVEGRSLVSPISGRR